MDSSTWTYFNSDWVLSGRSAGAERYIYEPLGFIGLPILSASIFSIEFYVGYGWYRNTLSLAQCPANDVSWIEGRFKMLRCLWTANLLSSFGAIQGFPWCDDAVKPGDISCCSSIIIGILNWYQGREHVSAGIYRDVYLVLTNRYMYMYGTSNYPEVSRKLQR